jgi:hypothetical protein
MMAKMTKAERQAAEASAYQQNWNEFRASYPERFANLLYEFGKLGAGAVAGANFKVERLGHLTYLFKEVNYPVEAKLYVTLPEEYQPDYIWEFETIERVVAEYYAKVAEADRQYRVRRDALEKVRSTLSSEELKLLGL